MQNINNIIHSPMWRCGEASWASRKYIGTCQPCLHVSRNEPVVILIKRSSSVEQVRPVRCEGGWSEYSQRETSARPRVWRATSAERTVRRTRQWHSASAAGRTRSRATVRASWAELSERHATPYRDRACFLEIPPGWRTRFFSSPPPGVNSTRATRN